MPNKKKKDKKADEKQTEEDGEIAGVGMLEAEMRDHWIKRDLIHKMGKYFFIV